RRLARARSHGVALDLARAQRAVVRALRRARAADLHRRLHAQFLAVVPVLVAAAVRARPGARARTDRRTAPARPAALLRPARVHARVRPRARDVGPLRRGPVAGGARAARVARAHGDRAPRDRRGCPGRVTDQNVVITSIATRSPNSSWTARSSSLVL